MSKSKTPGVSPEQLRAAINGIGPLPKPRAGSVMQATAVADAEIYTVNWAHDTDIPLLVGDLVTVAAFPLEATARQAAEARGGEVVRWQLLDLLAVVNGFGLRLYIIPNTVDGFYLSSETVDMSAGSEYTDR